MDYLKILGVFNGGAKESPKNNDVSKDQAIDQKKAVDEARLQEKLSREKSMEEVAKLAAQETRRVQISQDEARISTERSIETARSISEAESIETKRKQSYEFRVQNEKPILKTKKRNTKVSFVMQANLGNYAGQIGDAEEYFLNAVKSFLIQTDKNCELVIVSDGCKRVMELYYERFANYNNIKFAYVDRPVQTAHRSNYNNKLYNRVEARNIGILLATGEWIAYLNANDMLAPHATEIIKVELYKFANNVNFLFSQSKYVDQERVLPPEKEFKSATNFKFDFIEGEWRIAKYKAENLFDCKADSFVHAKSFPVVWKDSIDKTPAFEIAVSALTAANMTNVGLIQQPYYINATT